MQISDTNKHSINQRVFSLRQDVLIVIRRLATSYRLTLVEEASVSSATAVRPLICADK